METLAKQTNAALDSMAKARGGRPRPAPRPQVARPAFSDAYPKDGVSYTVQKGDSIGLIAKKTGAKAQDIIDANKLADPSGSRPARSSSSPGASSACGSPSFPTWHPPKNPDWAADSAPSFPRRSRPRRPRPRLSAAVPPAQGYQEIQVHLVEPSPYQARREIAPSSSRSSPRASGARACCSRSSCAGTARSSS
jgi:hypothetical protein